MSNPHLDKRPEAGTPTIERLVDWVREGRVRLPRFQRALRWRSEHVINLFDSIARGFPIGVLLMAQQQASAEITHFGVVQIASPERQNGLYVIDGQQRITALAGALLHPDLVPYGDIHAIWFDLVNQTFHRLRTSKAPPTWLPLNVVLDSFRLLTWLNDWPLRADQPLLVHAALRLGKAIREYQVPSYTVEGASEEALRFIFKRTNTSGIAMRESEVFDALHGSAARAPLADSCFRLTNLGYGEIDPPWFLACVKAVGQQSSKLRFVREERSIPDETIAAAERAVTLALAFLASDAGIAHVDLLPYRLPLVVLARFFALHPQPGLRTRLLLSRWLWRGALAGIHGNNSNATMDDLLRAIGPDQSQSVQALLARVPKTIEVLPSASRTWHRQSAETKALAVGLLHLRPRDPLGQEVIDPTSGESSPLNAFWDAHFAVGKVPVARRLFLPATRPDAARRLFLRLLDAPAAVLESHAISPPALAALRSQDFMTFTQERCRTLDPWLERFFRERAGLGDNDRPAIQDIAKQAMDLMDPSVSQG